MLLLLLQGYCTLLLLLRLLRTVAAAVSAQQTLHGQVSSEHGCII
jgi:hypothetical protein